MLWRAFLFQKHRYTIFKHMSTPEPLDEQLELPYTDEHGHGHEINAYVGACQHEPSKDVTPAKQQQSQAKQICPPPTGGFSVPLWARPSH